MQSVTPTVPELTIVGRSTSHFTRVTRIFAAEAGLAYSFEVVPDLRHGEEGSYAGNPALKVPILRTARGTWFGALNICRELSRRASAPPRLIWPEQLEGPLLANAQELVVQAMSTEVTLLMSRVFGTPDDDAHLLKLRRSLSNTVEWLEQHVEEALAQLPASRDSSYLELTLYCLVRHLPFRDVMSTEPYTRLNAFCGDFERRPSVRDTAYRVDA